MEGLARTVTQGAADALPWASLLPPFRRRFEERLSSIASIFTQSISGNLAVCSLRLPPIRPAFQWMSRWKAWGQNWSCPIGWNGTGAILKLICRPFDYQRQILRALHDRGYPNV